MQEFKAFRDWGQFASKFPGNLVAPYCAIPRDYLSDTLLLRAMGFLVSQHGQLDAIPPPPFLSISPLESMQSGGAIPPPQKGYLSDTCAIPYENKANGCDTPLCDTISKGYCAIWGGISHWAAKPGNFPELSSRTPATTPETVTAFSSSLRIFWGLFLRNNLKGLKEPPKIKQITLRNAIVSLFYSVFSEGL